MPSSFAVCNLVIVPILLHWSFALIEKTARRHKIIVSYIGIWTLQSYSAALVAYIFHILLLCELWQLALINRTWGKGPWLRPAGPRSYFFFFLFFLCSMYQVILWLAVSAERNRYNPGEYIDQASRSRIEKHYWLSIHQTFDKKLVTLWPLYKAKQGHNAPLTAQEYRRPKFGACVK
jgi:hypothetical protein